MSVYRIIVLLSAQQLSKVSYSSHKMTEPDRAAWSSIEHLSWRFDSARWCTKAGSVRFDARHFEPSPLLGLINLEPISSQIERLGIDCHLCASLPIRSAVPVTQSLRPSDVDLILLEIIFAKSNIRIIGSRALICICGYGNNLIRQHWIFDPFIRG